MTHVNALYGRDNLNLRTKVWEKGFKEQGMGKNHGLSPEMLAWLEKAVDTYWHQRAYSILNAIGTASTEASKAAWDQLLDDMYGDDTNRKLDAFHVAMNDDKIGDSAKAWLKKHTK